MPAKTADICDGHAGSVRVLTPMFQDYGGRVEFSGPVSTVKLFEDNSRVREAVSEPGEGRVGHVTSPWWSPELGCNIALGYVPWRLSQLGTRLTVELPEAYVESSGQPVAAEVSEVPFRPSAHPSARERARQEGRDSAF